MSVEHTHICDRCGARHTSDDPPLGWKSNVRVEVSATGLPPYSTYAVDETRELLCDGCLAYISAAVSAALNGHDE